MRILLAILLTCLVAGAQEYKSRQPTARERERIAGLSYYPADAPNSGWYQFTPVTNHVVHLSPGKTNNVIVYGTGGSNVVVWIPSPTNQFGTRYKIVSSGVIALTISNVTGLAFHDTTNYPVALASSWLMRSNSAVDVYTATGTNWFVLPTKQ